MMPGNAQQRHSTQVVQLAIVVVVATVVVFMAGLSVASNPDKDCTFSTYSEAQGVCGDNLVGLIQLVCDNVHSNGYRYRRSLEKNHLNVDARLQALQLKPKRALSYLTKRPSSGTIVCECCYHQCAISEVRNFCSGS